MAVEGVALRKRQQIAKANRTMFLWVAGVSAVVGIALVASVFLVQKMIFNEKVLSEKAKTASVLEKNNGVVGELQNQIRVLNTNESLKRVMVPGENQPVQVVLDALPAEANSSAFGASLQRNFLTAEGIRLDSLTVDPVAGIEVQSDVAGQEAATPSDALNDGSAGLVTFNFTVSVDSGNANALRDLLLRLERSIRPIDLTSIVIEAQGERLALRVDGRTYYQPAVSTDLKEKVVKP